MALVSFDKATRRYPGSETAAVDELSLDIADGEFLVLVGPSGSGKTTALRMLAGLEDVDEGDVRIGDRDVTHMRSKDRDIAMVFQSYALYPHMTVRDNLGFALKLRGTPKPDIKDKVAEAARLLEIEDFLDRKPKALSGGQRQRVAMGRAIVRDPSVFLMDEPLSNLDAKLRVDTRSNIAALQRRLGTTTVYVTHDQVEAMTMGHRVAVLRDGLLQQVDTPQGLYNRPANAFVAGFIGSPAMNLVDVPVHEGTGELGEIGVPLPHAVAGEYGTLTLGLRPEELRPVGDGEDGVETVVELVEELGADAYLHCRVRNGHAGPRLVVRVDGRTPPQAGETVRIALREACEPHLFCPDSGARVGEPR